jgi:hypothetical protein
MGKSILLAGHGWVGAGNDQVEILDTAYSLLDGFAVYGVGDGQADATQHCVSDSTYYYVSDYFNNRVQKFDIATQTYQAKKTGLTNPRQLATDGTYLYVSVSGLNKIYKLNCSDLSEVTSAAITAPFGMTLIGTNLFVTGENKLYKRLASDLSAVAFIGGAAGTGNMEFSGPCACHANGSYVYVADSGNHRIKKHDITDAMNYVAKIGSSGVGNDQFNAPRGIWCDGDNVWVAEFANGRINCRDTDLVYVSKSGLGSFGSIWGISIRSVAFGSIQVAGAWKDILDAQIQVGGAWKTATALQIQVGNTWKNTA